MSLETSLQQVQEIRTLDGNAAGVDLATLITETDLKRLARWKVKSISLLFTTDVNAANRTLKFQIIDRSNNILFETSHGTVIAASQAVRFTIAPNVHYRDYDAVADTVVLPMPDIFFEEGYTLATEITNIQVGGTITALVIVADRWEGDILTDER